MKMGKRIFLFMATNILIVATITLVTSVLGIQPYLSQNGINFQSLMAFCLVWGFGGAFISLALSRVMAKWTMGVQIIDPTSATRNEKWLAERVYYFAQKSGLSVMPEVGIYHGPELNAFATGPTKNRALVAVSTGLLERMNEAEIEGVLAHEVAHIANGDMVTMTLIQGVVNAFVMFLARVIGWFASQFVDEDKRSWVQFGVVFVAQIFLGILGMVLVAAFSRAREYRADAGGAGLAGAGSMIAALSALKMNLHPAIAQASNNEPALASLKISGQRGFVRWFSTHPDLDDRIDRLRNVSEQR